MTATTTRSVEWLASTHPDPPKAHAGWYRRQTVLFPAGHVWDAVELPATTDSTAGQAALHELGISGPVAHDPRQRIYYVLVPAGTAARSSLPGTQCLGNSGDRDRSDCWVGLPSPARVAGPGQHWAIPPDGTGRLTNPEELRAALVAHAANGTQRQNGGGR